jgi:hypothetical protein
MKVIMINVGLTQPAPWPYAGNACAKSQAGFSSLIHKRMCAAMRHFLCPKKVFALLFSMGGYAGGFGLPGLVTGLLTRIICPPQPQGL